MMKKLVFTLILLIACLTGVLFYGFNTLQNARPVFNQHELVDVKAGKGLSQLCRKAIKERQSLICNSLKLYAKFYPEITQLKAGLYEYQNEHLLAFITKITQGEVKQFSFTIIEGSTFKHVLTQIKEAPYLIQSDHEQIASALKQAGLTDENPEGWLFPETYHYQAGDSDITILLRAYQEMVDVLSLEWQNKQADLPLKNKYEALILASLIEKESGKGSELPLISSVFKNRLNLNMRLQTDPTVIYGLGDAYQGDIKRVHLKQKTPYNTYQIKGLPPTPIAMPSLASIRAAVHPVTSEYLYFVASGDGGHYFSKTLEEHNRAVRKYILKK
jgi:UPF0755 protein